MIALLTNLARAAALFLEIKAVRAHWDLTNDIEEHVAKLEREIEALRSDGSPAAQLRADRLRNRLVRAQGIVANLPAARPPPVQGPVGPDEGRDVQPADR